MTTSGNEPVEIGILGTISTTTGVRLIGVPICPDMLRYDQIGAADGFRGHVVRAFFWLMRAWPPSASRLGR